MYMIQNPDPLSFLEKNSKYKKKKNERSLNTICTKGTVEKQFLKF